MNYLDIQKDSDAYLVGLLMADGCLTTNNTVRIALQKADKVLLERLVEVFTFLGRVKYCKTNDQYYIAVKNKSLYLELISYGIKPRKSFENKNEIFIHKDMNLNGFIRGFFDGDGCIFTPPQRPNLRYIQLYSVSDKFLYMLKDHLPGANITSRTSESFQDMHVLTISSYKNVEQFISFIYKDACIYLQRKKEISDSWTFKDKIIDRAIKCLICRSIHTTKNGLRNNKQRMKCRSCNHHFTIPEASLRSDA